MLHLMCLVYWLIYLYMQICRWGLHSTITTALHHCRCCDIWWFNDNVIYFILGPREENWSAQKWIQSNTKKLWKITLFSFTWFLHTLLQAKDLNGDMYDTLIPVLSWKRCLFSLSSNISFVFLFLLLSTLCFFQLRIIRMQTILFLLRIKVTKND